MKTYVRYQDDGSCGICGHMDSQDQLHIFKDEKSAHEFMKIVENSHTRKNERITGIWMDDQDVTLYPSVQKHY